MGFTNSARMPTFCYMFLGMLFFLSNSVFNNVHGISFSAEPNRTTEALTGFNQTFAWNLSLTAEEKSKELKVQFGPWDKRHSLVKYYLMTIIQEPAGKEIEIRANWSLAKRLYWTGNLAHAHFVAFQLTDVKRQDAGDYGIRFRVDGFPPRIKEGWLTLSVQDPPVKSTAAGAQMSITAKEPTGMEKEGSSYTFKWDFHLPSSGSLREIVFGLWEKGYTSSYFMTVTKRFGAVENPELRKKHPDYVDRVQWMGDISASYAAFRLKNLKLSDNKTYGCQLSFGDYGQTIDSKITLIVQKASLESKTSVFLHVPQARNAIVGQVTEFKWEYRLSDADSKDVKALQLSQSSNPQTKQLVLWKAQNNVNTTNPKYAKRLLATKNKRHNSRTLSYSFKLFNVTLNDEGNFTFKVEFGNQLRNVKRRVFLDVQERPKIITFQQVKRPYKEGDQLFLACDAKERPQKIRWIKNGRVIAHQTKSYFHINKLSISDAGVYSCCAYYPLGNASSLAVHVRVQYTRNMTLQVKEGDKLNITCRISLEASSTIVWMRDNIPVHTGQSMFLFIASVNRSQAGNYICVSLSPTGNRTSAITAVNVLYIDECTNDPCENGGSCVNSSPGSYTCNCAEGYKGDHCQDVNWKSEGCFKEKKRKRSLLKKRFNVVLKGINKKNPDIELILIKCKAIAEKKGYEIFTIRGVNRCYTSKNGKLVDFKKYGTSSKCKTDERGHGVGMNAKTNFVYTR